MGSKELSKNNNVDVESEGGLETWISGGEFVCVYFDWKAATSKKRHGLYFMSKYMHIQQYACICINIKMYMHAQNMDATCTNTH